MSDNFTAIDALIVAVYLVGTIVAGLAVRKYVGKVEHFLVAGREMDVNLGIASLAATEFGIITCMYTAQNGYLYGFAGAVPGIANALAMLIVGTTGFCIKPLRAAGVMTIPELFENRFGARIRWASGVVIVLGGLLNMGVFLRTGGEFLVIVTGLDPQYLEITMTLLLVVVALYTILGGMLSVLVTDFLQFIVMSIGLLAVTFLVLTQVGWTTLTETAATRIGDGAFNPFLNPDLGWTFVLFQVLSQFAVVLTWQTMIARVLAARDPRTAQKVYTRTSFFFVCRFMIPALWGLAALALLAPAAAGEPTNSLHAMPTMLATLLPTGLLGLLIAAMLAADMSTDSSYMLTWSSIIYNDVLRPLRKREWSERTGLIVNRLIVAGIGIFLLLYGLWYPLQGDLWSYLLLTGTVYSASMSTLLIACLYWRRANTIGAAAAIVAGAVVPLTYLVLQLLPSTRDFAARTGPNVWGIAAFAAAACAMVVGSLIGARARASSEVR